MGNGIQKRSHSLSHWYFWLGSTIPTSVLVASVVHSSVRFSLLGFVALKSRHWCLARFFSPARACVCVRVRVCVCACACVGWRSKSNIPTLTFDMKSYPDIIKKLDSWYEVLPRRHKKTLTVDMKCYLLQLMCLTSQNNNHPTVNMKCCLCPFSYLPLTSLKQLDSYEVMPLSLQLPASDVTKKKKKKRVHSWYEVLSLQLHASDVTKTFLSCLPFQLSCMCQSLFSVLILEKCASLPHRKCLLLYSSWVLCPAIYVFPCFNRCKRSAPCTL